MVTTVLLLPVLVAAGVTNLLAFAAYLLVMAAVAGAPLMPPPSLTDLEAIVIKAAVAVALAALLLPSILEQREQRVAVSLAVHLATAL